MVRTLAERVAARWNSYEAEEEAKELLEEMLGDVPMKLWHVLDRVRIETRSERRIDDIAYATIDWEGTDDEDEPVVSVSISAHVGVSADEDGLFGFKGAGYELSGEDFQFDWHGETYNFDDKFKADARKVHEKLKTKAPEIAKLFV